MRYNSLIIDLCLIRVVAGIKTRRLRSGIVQVNWTCRICGCTTNVGRTRTCTLCLSVKSNVVQSTPAVSVKTRIVSGKILRRKRYSGVDQSPPIRQVQNEPVLMASSQAVGISSKCIVLFVCRMT